MQLCVFGSGKLTMYAIMRVWEWKTDARFGSSLSDRWTILYIVFEEWKESQRFGIHVAVHDLAVELGGR